MWGMLNIVLYEEDFLMRDLLQEWLTAAGYYVRIAAQRGLPSDGRADLVVASVYMPKHAGAEFVRNISAAHPGTPIIAISGQFRSGLCQAGSTAEALGVQQVIAKPLIRSDFVKSVRAIIGDSD
jgi:DNA-binding response OmpR family regulator